MSNNQDKDTIMTKISFVFIMFRYGLLFAASLWVGCSSTQTVGTHTFTFATDDGNRILTCESDCSVCYQYSPGGIALNTYTISNSPEIKECVRIKDDKDNTVTDWEYDLTNCLWAKAFNCYNALLYTVTDPAHAQLVWCRKKQLGVDPEKDEVDDKLVVIEAAEGALNKYGFDDWRKIFINDATKDLIIGQPVSYLSVATQSSSQIKISIHIPSAVYDRYDAVLTGSNSSIWFDAAHTIRKLVLQSGENTIPLYTGSWEGNAEVEVWAYVGAGEAEKSVCLTGDKTKGDLYNSAADRLVVYVADEQVVPVDIGVYLVESEFTTDAKTYADNVNGYLKQAVAKVDESYVTVTRWTSAERDWDLNGNGKFDIINGVGIMDRVEWTKLPLVPESYTMEAQIGGPLREGCIPKVVSESFVIKGGIRSHSVLVYDYNKDDLTYSRTLFLNSVAGVRSGNVYRVVRYYDSDMDLEGHYELIWIDLVNSVANEVTFHKFGPPGEQPLDHDYDAVDGISIFIDGGYGGITEFEFARDLSTTNCSFCEDNAGYKVLTHEFLHQNVNGFYRHVGNIDSKNGDVSPYKDNLMYNGTEIGDQLLYRTLKVINGEKPTPTPYSQWEKIRE
jgi:hypothetical protein